MEEETKKKGPNLKAFFSVLGSDILGFSSTHPFSSLACGCCGSVDGDLDLPFLQGVCGEKKYALVKTRKKTL